MKNQIKAILAKRLGLSPELEYKKIHVLLPVIEQQFKIYKSMQQLIRN